MIDTLVTAAGSGMNFLMAAINNQAAVKRNIKQYLRAYYFEVIQNLDLLDTIREEKLTKTKVNSPEFVALINSLETTVAKFILFGNANYLYEPFKRIEIFETDDEDALEDSNNNKLVGQIEVKETLANSMISSVNKIEILKKLSACKVEDGELLHDFRLKPRIHNIKQRLIAIRKTLARFVMGNSPQ